MLSFIDGSFLQHFTKVAYGYTPNTNMIIASARVFVLVYF